ncbi:MAG: hypothetical protein RL088_1672 [Verrucomicrobiota bacterium]|jgi:hypothetical protein
MKVRVYLVTSFLFYAIAIIVGDAYAAGSTFRAGIGQALFFGRLFVVVTFPILVGVGFLLRWVAERLFHRPLPYRSVLPWLVHVPLSIVFLSSAIPDSPKTLFRRYVADDVPQSLKEVRLWRTSGFGNSTVVMSFRIAPSEFSRVLSRYEYVEHKESETATPPILAHLAEGRLDFPILLPASPLVYRYSHLEPGPEGGLRVSHYATKSKDYVVTVRTFN